MKGWVKWWRDNWAIPDVRKILIMMGLYSALMVGILGWSIYDSHRLSVQGLKRNCACRCDP